MPYYDEIFNTTPYGYFLNKIQDKANPNITFVGFYPYPETTTENYRVSEYYFKAIAFSYGVRIQVVKEPREIIIDERPVISMEEPNRNNKIFLPKFKHPRDAIYITGNSKYEYPSDYMKVDYIVSLEMEQAFVPLYGAQVAAIVMYDRWNKKIF